MRILSVELVIYGYNASVVKLNARGVTEVGRRRTVEHHFLAKAFSAVAADSHALTVRSFSSAVAEKDVAR